jgi:hypothetical protein
MDPHEPTGAAGLLDKRYHAVRELLEIVNDWRDSADFEDAAALSAHLEKRRKAIENVFLIDRELDKIRRELPAARHAGSERTGKVNEMLRQIQLLTARDREEIKNRMAYYLKEAAMAAIREKRAQSDMKSGIPARGEPV